MSKLNRKPTVARPLLVNGVTFRCYRIPHLRTCLFEWQDETGQLCVGSNYNLKTYYAVKGLERLPTRFRTRVSAMKAVTK